MEFRKLYSALDLMNSTEAAGERIEFIDSQENIFSVYAGDIENDMTIRTCIDTIARHVSKLRPMHIIANEDGRVTQDSALNYLLSQRPNPYLSTYDFLYKVTSQVLLHGNAFVYVDKKGNNILGLYPIDFNSLELKEINNEFFCQFKLRGAQKAVPYTDIIHIRRQFLNRQFYGSTAKTSLYDTLELLDTAKQSISNRVKNSGKLQGILKLSGNSKVSDWEASAKSFADKFLSFKSNSGGIGAIDSSMEFQPIHSQVESAQDSQLEFIQQEIYRFYGINDSIIKGDYTSTQWQSFYESVIEPLAIQLSQEFTAKLFTMQQQRDGNSIIFNSNRLAYTSVNAKVSMIREMGQLGLLTINEAREIVDLPPVENGDVRLVSLNYVNANKADQYQLGETGEDPDHFDDDIEDEDKEEETSQQKGGESFE